MVDITMPGSPSWNQIYDLVLRLNHAARTAIGRVDALRSRATVASATALDSFPAAVLGIEPGAVLLDLETLRSAPFQEQIEVVADVTAEVAGRRSTRTSQVARFLSAIDYRQPMSTGSMGVENGEYHSNQTRTKSCIGGCIVWVERIARNRGRLTIVVSRQPPKRVAKDRGAERSGAEAG